MDAALDDGPERLPGLVRAGELGVPGATAIQPAQGALHALAREIVRRLAGNDVIERHGDVRAERPLNLHRPLRGERAVGAVDVALEVDALLGDPPEAFQREDLKASRVGEHRALPRGEPVEPAHRLDHFLAGPEVEVVRVAENDLGAGAAHVGRAEAADDPMGADRHERRRLHLAMRQRERAGARGAVRALQPEGESHSSGEVTQPVTRPPSLADRAQHALDLPPMHEVVGRHEPQHQVHAFLAALAVQPDPRQLRRRSVRQSARFAVRSTLS